MPARGEVTWLSADSREKMAGKSSTGLLSRVPILVILGTTGAGKSKLGIDLAKKFCGEVISADSMQVYQGLNIITNKVTNEEQQQIPHHVFSEIDPLKKFTVVDFRNRSLPIIEKLLKSKTLPVIVGGTNYYIESLLWEILIDNPPNDDTIVTQLINDNDNSFEEPVNKKNKLEENEEDSISLYKKLTELDPDRAKTLHPNNKRKIIRSLQIISQKKIKHSALIKEQNMKSGSTLGGPLRFKDVVIFWIQSEQSVLDKRLDDRVDDMMKRGLIQELLEFHKSYNEDRLKSNLIPDYTTGIFQSIGFKEFHNYLILSDEERLTEKGTKLLEEGIFALKLVTRRYARKQIKWIKNRFLRKPDREVPPVYSLDSTDPTLWDQKVLEPAFKIVESVISGTGLPEGISPLPIDSPLNNEQKTFHCEECERLFVGGLQWRHHLDSKKHAKMKNRKKKEQEKNKEEN